MCVSGKKEREIGKGNVNFVENGKTREDVPRVLSCVRGRHTRPLSCDDFAYITDEIYRIENDNLPSPTYQYPFKIYTSLGSTDYYTSSSAYNVYWTVGNKVFVSVDVPRMVVNNIAFSTATTENIAINLPFKMMPYTDEGGLDNSVFGAETSLQRHTFFCNGVMHNKKMGKSIEIDNSVSDSKYFIKASWNQVNDDDSYLIINGNDLHNRVFKFKATFSYIAKFPLEVV